MSFRFDINALRALAVAGVVFYHYDVPYLGGGFTGVDIFFVISGYLMTRIILQGLEKNNFLLLEFYAKRVKRIMPALLALVASVTVLSFFLYLPQDYITNENNGAFSTIFLSNIWYWQHSSYFDAASASNMFLHTWSLSVEWQFYILFPIILVLFKKYVHKKTLLLYSFILISIILYAISVKLTHKYASLSFYLLPTRAWEMLAGGICYLMAGKINNAYLKILLSVIGYFTLLYCFVFFNDKMPWPGIFTIVPVSATALIILANLEFKVIRHKAIQFLGNTSYSLYLWHWPIFVFAGYFGLQLNSKSIVLLCIAALILGYISFKYIESIKVANAGKILAVAVCLFAINITVAQTGANKFLFSPFVIKMSKFKESYLAHEVDEQWSRGKCFFMLKDANMEVDSAYCFGLDDNRPNILLMGDSHAGQYSKSLREYFDKKKWNLLQSTTSGSLPLSSTNGLEVAYRHTRYMYTDYLVKNKKRIKGVILSGNWYSYLNGGNDLLIADLKKTLNLLNSLGIKCKIIGQNEVYTLPYPVILAKESHYSFGLKDLYKKKAALITNILLKKTFPKNYVDVYHYTITPKNSNLGQPYMYDENHLTKYGADMVLNSPNFEAALNELAL